MVQCSCLYTCNKSSGLIFRYLFWPINTWPDLTCFYSCKLTCPDLKWAFLTWLLLPDCSKMTSSDQCSCQELWVIKFFDLTWPCLAWFNLFWPILTWPTWLGLIVPDIFCPDLTSLYLSWHVFYSLQTPNKHFYACNTLYRLSRHPPDKLKTPSTHSPDILIILGAKGRVQKLN